MRRRTICPKVSPSAVLQTSLQRGVRQNMNRLLNVAYDVTFYEFG